MDRVTGEQGFNLAAVMLLGYDDVILDIVPTYMTDALLRRINVDRYDDREIVQTNLIESYERLMEFGHKHLPDKFFLEDDQRKSLRNIITREMIANTLIHREYTSSYQAKFVIENERMYVENANRALQQAVLTPDNMEPLPKNPIIASFFRNIGYADQLGSGVRNLFKYSKFYSGDDPKFMEGDIFRIIVPLNERKTKETITQSATQSTQSDEIKPVQRIIEIIEQNPLLSQKQMAEKLSLNQNTLKYYIKKMREKELLKELVPAEKESGLLNNGKMNLSLHNSVFRDSMNWNQERKGGIPIWVLTKVLPGYMICLWTIYPMTNGAVT